MPYPFPNGVPEGTLTQLKSIDAVAEAEAGILSCMSALLYTPTSTTDPKPKSPSLLANINALLTDDSGNVLPLTSDVASLIKQILCAYACKEVAIADIVNALACKLGITTGVISAPDDDTCDCCFIRK